VVSRDLFTALIAVVALERLIELRVAKRNLAWSRARGGEESGFGHYPAMVVLHTGLLAGALVEVWAADRAFVPAIGWAALVIVVAAQALRWWCIRTLDFRWNTRIVVVPGLVPVRAGPYAYLRHPNYMAVVAEGLALPLIHDAWITAIVFTIANAALLAIRIPAENRAMTRAHA
jgi:methyltransferase